MFSKSGFKASQVHKRLAIIRRSYRSDGGAERIITRIIEGFRQDDSSSLDVSVITQSWRGEANGAHVITVPKRGFTRTRKFKFFNDSVTAVLGQSNFDLVQSHERVPGCQIYRAGDGVHQKWLAIRDEYSKSALQKWFWRKSPFHSAIISAEKELFEHSKLKKVICNSIKIKQDILDYYPQVDADKLIVIYNGIDLEEFCPASDKHRAELRYKLGYKDDDRLLVFVGSGFERKGLALLLEALPEVPQWQLIVVGKDKNQKKYESMCERLGILERVRFLGMQGDVRPFYLISDLLVHPAYYDPAPNVVLEAMACGCAVVLSENCGNAEWVSHGQNGFVTKPGSSQALVEVLQETYSLDLRAMGLLARERVSEYSIDRMVTEMQQLYNGILRDEDSSY